MCSTQFIGDGLPKVYYDVVLKKKWQPSPSRCITINWLASHSPRRIKTDRSPIERGIYGWMSVCYFNNRYGTTMFAIVLTISRLVTRRLQLFLSNFKREFVIYHDKFYLNKISATTYSTVVYTLVKYHGTFVLGLSFWGAGHRRYKKLPIKVFANAMLHNATQYSSRVYGKYHLNGIFRIDFSGTAITL